MGVLLQWRAVVEFVQWFGVAGRWAQANGSLLAWSFGASLILFFGSLILMPVLIARMRADYFVTPDPDRDSWLGRHPAARTTARVLKNSGGVVLLIAGLAMMVLPGQGIITLLVALSLLDFPGKRQLELRLVRQPQVRGAINWIRGRAGRRPIQIPD